MAVGEQTSEVATAPSSDSFTLAVGRHTAEKRQAPDGDVAGGDFGDLCEVEAVHVPGGVLPEPVPNAHCVIVECDPAVKLREDLLPEMTECSAHLSASATPDKARDIDMIAQRIGVLHEHLQKSNVSSPPHLPVLCTTMHNFARRSGHVCRIRHMVVSWMQLRCHRFPHHVPILVILTTLEVQISLLLTPFSLLFPDP